MFIPEPPLKKIDMKTQYMLIRADYTQVRIKLMNRNEYQKKTIREKYKNQRKENQNRVKEHMNIAKNSNICLIKEREARQHFKKQ